MFACNSVSVSVVASARARVSLSASCSSPGICSNVNLETSTSQVDLGLVKIVASSELDCLQLVDQFEYGQFQSRKKVLWRVIGAGDLRSVADYCDENGFLQEGLTLCL